jgi:hypothetical protein
MDTIRTWAHDNVRLSDWCDNDVQVTHHKGLEVWAPPLSETVTNFPVIVDPMGGVELTRVTGRSQAFV